MYSSRERAKEQRSSNIFGAPDKEREEEVARLRKQMYRDDLHQQMNDNVHHGQQSRRNDKDHPLESRVEKYSITMRKQKASEDEPDPVGEFYIGSDNINSYEIQKQKVEYKANLAEDLRIKREYLENEEENYIKNRKPVQRNLSPDQSHEFLIGGESIENERMRKENAIAFARGNAPARTKDKRLGEEDHSGFFVGDDDVRHMSKKDRMRMQYKRDLDDQVDTHERMKREEEDRIRAQDRHNASMRMPYSGNSDFEEKRKQDMIRRQDYLQQRAAVNLPPQEQSYDRNEKITFTIGSENENSRYIAQKQADYKHALDEQMYARSQKQQEDLEFALRENEKYSLGKVPYLESNRDDE